MTTSNENMDSFIATQLVETNRTLRTNMTTSNEDVDPFMAMQLAETNRTLELKTNIKVENLLCCTRIVINNTQSQYKYSVP